TGRTQADAYLAQRRAREAGHHAQRLAHDLVDTSRGDGAREPGGLDGCTHRHPVIGPRHHVVAVDLLHDGPRSGVVVGDAEVRDLAAQRVDGELNAELLTEASGPRAAGDH